MKKTFFLILTTTVYFMSSCSSSKTSTNKELFNTKWELEYITGPRIAFDGLFPDLKPQISFNEKTNEVSGTASCNGYLSNYTLDKNAITFGEPGPTTMMFCEGGGENVFLDMMKKVTSYSIEDQKLNLKTNNVTLMRFKKVIE